MCDNCKGSGYICNIECLVCKYYIVPGREDLVLRGQLFISDKADPVSPVSSPR
jgi:hypothetical protein